MTVRSHHIKQEESKHKRTFVPECYGTIVGPI